MREKEGRYCCRRKMGSRLREWTERRVGQAYLFQLTFVVVVVCFGCDMHD